MNIHIPTATRLDYAAVNARGITIRTFGDLTQARQWVHANHELHTGLIVEEVATTVTRRRVYRPRQAQLRLVGAA